MKLKKGVKGSDFVAYGFDTGDGQRSEAEMPASVALEVVMRKQPRRVEGDRLAAGGYDFPAAIFEIEEGDLVEAAKPRRRRTAPKASE